MASPKTELVTFLSKNTHYTLFNFEANEPSNQAGYVKVVISCFSVANV